MKKCIILGIVIVQIFTSCQKNKVATIKGEVHNYDNTPLLIVDNKISPVADTIFVKDGKFSKSIQSDNPCFKILDFGEYRKEIFLNPGQTLIISFNASKTDRSFKYEGTLATENAVLDSLNLRFNNFSFQSLSFLPVQKASKNIDSTFEAATEYIENLARSKNVNPVFYEYIKASVEYYFADLKTMVAWRNDVKDSAFYSFLDEIPIENKKYLDIPNYRRFLVNYIRFHADREYNKLDSVKKKMPFAYFDGRLKVIEGINDIKVREYLIFRTLSTILELNGAKGFYKYADYFKAHNTDSIYALRIRKEVARKLLLSPGMPAPEFSCTDVDSNTFSLKDFKGKYVYIDFWATWCDPCIQELPGYIKLQYEYKGKNIVFVSISLDVYKKIWKKVIDEYKSESINLLADTVKGWNSDVAKDYQIAEIPAYVLIDKEGRIIDRYASGPSSNEIRKTLDELLKAN